MSHFREFDRETGFLLPPSLDDWLPERHLARFVVEVIDGLDLSAMVKSYRGTGSAGYHPALLKDAVTTPAGCTVDGILELEEGGLRVTLIKAVKRATQRAKELANG